MRLRAELKKLVYNHAFRQNHSFPYYGVNVHFPRNSLIFKMACDQGIYESENLNLLLELIPDDGVFFDVGANIGLISVPVLVQKKQSMVVSLEPSPNAIPYLEKTHQGFSCDNRWKLIGKAVGSEIGNLEFSCTRDAELGAFDSLSNKNVERISSSDKVSVEVTTLDDEWKKLSKPKVDCVKIDVEGAEELVLRGMHEIIENCHPAILVEWNRSHLKGFGTDLRVLNQFSKQNGYTVFSSPSLVKVESDSHLQVLMVRCENYLLLPN